MKPAKNDPRYWLDEYAPRLLAYARQWASSSNAAEDIFQDAFVRFWRKRESVRDPVTYLYRCVRTTAMNSHRSQNRRQHHEIRSAPGREPASPQAAAELSERQMCIQRAIAELPVDQREVVVMKIWGEMTFSRIGKVMSLPRSTAHATYRTAMNRLYKKLDRET
mgnify:CR=1 FL=1